MWWASQTSKGTGHQNLPSSCVECRSRILQNFKIKTLVERGLVVAVEVYILRGQTLNWIPELQLCQIPTQTFFYLNWNCKEERFQKRKFTYFIQNKTGSFFCRDRCCKMSEQMFSEHARAFWRRHNSSFNGPQEMSFSIVLPFLIPLSLAGIKV